MALSVSVSVEQRRRALGIFFALSSVIPLLLLVYVVEQYAVPFLKPYQVATLSIVILYCVIGMVVTSFLGYLWISRNISPFSSLTDYLMSRMAAGEKDRKTGECYGESFYTIFKTTGDKRQTSRLSVVSMSNFIDIVSTLTSELDFDRLFPKIISKITEVMNAERSSLYVVDWEKKELWSRVAEQVEQIRVPIGEGISGRVAESGRPVNVADAWKLPYFNREFDIKNDFRTRSVLCMPVKNRQGALIGVIQVINKKDKKRFDAADETYLRDLASQVSIALENSLLLDEMRLSFNSSISTLSATVDARHHFTAGHSERVMEYSLLIAEELGMTDEQTEVLRFAALLHDIGKIGIRDDVLLKNGPFTPEERAEMETHPVKTRSILKEFRFPRALKEVPDIALHHHERLDGTGYPEGLTETQLPIASRILAVADVFDAVTSPRDYPKYIGGEILTSDPMPLPEAIRIIQAGAGTQFDKKIVDAFMHVLPQALMHHRGVHFKPEYVDGTIRELAPAMMA